MSQGWQLRRAGLEDLPAIVQLVQLEDTHYRGHSDISLGQVEEQIAADSQFDAARDQVVAELGGQLIGAAIVNPRAVHISIHPEHDVERLRVELLAWAEHRQIELARECLRVGVAAANTPSVDFLMRAGYQFERFYALMVRAFEPSGPPEPAEVPSGYRLRAIDRSRDVAALHALDDRAFRGRPDYRPESLEEYDKRHISFSQFEPAWSLLAETVAGQPAGSLLGWRPPHRPHGYVAVLAVDPDHRRRGLARALLLTAFTAIHAAGLPTAELHVASDNPRALDVYLGVGMRQTERYDNYVRAA